MEHRLSSNYCSNVSCSSFQLSMNDVIQVDNLDLDPGTEITLDKVLLAGSLNYTLIGRPLLPTSTVKVSFDIWNYLYSL